MGGRGSRSLTKLESTETAQEADSTGVRAVQVANPEASDRDKTGLEADHREGSGGDKAVHVADRADGSSIDRAGPEADHAGGSGGSDLVQGVALNSDEVQLEAWKVAGRGEVVQAELDQTRRDQTAAWQLRIQTAAWQLRVVALQAMAWKPLMKALQATQEVADWFQSRQRPQGAEASPPTLHQ